MAYAPILHISDGTTTVNLLSQGSGLYLRSWTPNYPELKNNGVRASSPIAHGERITVHTYTDIIDTFELAIVGATQDNTIEDIQNLHRLLLKAQQYWTTDWQNDPVWIAARGPSETNTRYAIIKDYRWPNDSNPYAQPFFPQASRRPAMTEVRLILEHGIWQSEIPGDGLGVCIDGAQNDDLYEEDVFVPTAGTDDAYINQTAGGITTGASNLLFGRTATPVDYDTAVRFRNVAIPAGATIVRAYVVFTKYGAANGTDCIVDIYGEDNATPAAFSTYADYTARARTTATIEWNVPDWDGSDHLTTPDISNIIQEIVDRGDWSSGNDLAVFVQESASDDDAYRSACAQENDPPAEPELHVFWTMGTQTFGQEDAYEVFVANKHNHAQLTHIFTYSAVGGYSENLLGSGTPYDFDDERVLFGIATNAPNSGPFCSLVFDLNSANTAVSPAWQYSSAGGWVSFNDEDIQDNTEGLTYTNGVSSVHWLPQDDWEPQTYNGVEAWWISIDATDVTQQNRDVYTILWPYVDIEEDDVGGDMSALMQLRAYNVSGQRADDPVFVTVDENDSPSLTSTRSVWTDTDDQIIFRLSDDATGGLTTYSYTDAGELTYADQETVPTVVPRDVWAENSECYVAWYDAGLRVYEYDAAGNLTFTDDDSGITAYGVWYNGVYIIVTTGTSVDTYSYDAGTNTLTSVDTIAAETGGAYNIWGDDDYIYVGSFAGHVGIAIYTVSGAGALTHITNVDTNGNACYGLTGNDSFVFMNSEDRIQTYSKAVGNLVLEEEYITTDEFYHVAGVRLMWVGGNFLYATWREQPGGPNEIVSMYINNDGSLNAQQTIMRSHVMGVSGDHNNGLVFIGGSDIDAAQAHNVYSLRIDEFSTAPHTRLVCGLRSLERGENFDAFINLTGNQNEDNIGVAQIGSPLETGVPHSITGEYVTVTTTAVAEPSERVAITINDVLAEEYLGAYHAFLRVYQESGDAGDVTFRLAAAIGDPLTEIAETEIVSNLETGVISLVDLGTFIIPAVLARTRNVGDLRLSVQVGATDAGPIVTRLYDLILMPIDEWAGDFNNLSATTYLPVIGDGAYLEAGSITIPKRTITAYHYDADGAVQDVYLPISSGEAILQANKDQRLWFLEWTRTSVSNPALGDSEPCIALKISLYKAQRYFSMRGNR